jgi:aspartyl-tRNA(Asn)/glutamyl-tRNA(Gln) amidotransferase subunit A
MIAYMTGSELVSAYLSRELSPVEVLRETLDRVEELNQTFGVFITLSPEVALKQALASERRYAARAPASAVDGLPLTVKDIVATRGIRTTYGSLIWRDNVPDTDAPIVERLASAGTVLLGKTNTPEKAWKAESENRLIGPTRNPFDRDLTAGGSSGGAAVAAALGLGVLHQASDGAGSVRIPASFCGVFGFKPSASLIPQAPPSAAGDISQLGPITRTVRDSALFLDATAGLDSRDRWSYNTNNDYLSSCDGGVRGLRMAWSPDLGHAWVEPEVLQLVTAAVKIFEELGANVESAHPAVDDPWDILDTIWATAHAGMHVDDFEQLRSLMDPGRVKVIERGRSIRGDTVVAMQMKRNEYYESWRRFMDNYDVLLTPTVPITAFELGTDAPRQVNGSRPAYLEWTPFTYPFNLTGFPAATVPVGRTSAGLPVGLQIVGGFRADAVVLTAAAAFEQARPWDFHGLDIS